MDKGMSEIQQMSGVEERQLEPFVSLKTVAVPNPMSAQLRIEESLGAVQARFEATKQKAAAIAQDLSHKYSSLFLKSQLPDKDQLRILQKKKSVHAKLRSASVSLLARTGFIAGTVIGGIGAVEAYNILNSLPDVGLLPAQVMHSETSIIESADGRVVDEIGPEEIGIRRYDIPLEQVSPYLIQASVSTEDASFWKNWGFDVKGIIRAMKQNLESRGIVSGASTITQQLARAAFLSEEQPTNSKGRYVKKIKELVLAAELTRNYNKSEILELYLNQAYYGHGAYGVEAASQTYFGKSAQDLSIAESAFLASVVQSPSVYDPYTNKEVALQRFDDVIDLLVKHNTITAFQAQQAKDEMAHYTFNKLQGAYRYQQWVKMVENQLAQLYPGDRYYNAGVKVETTIDLSVQEAVAHFAGNHIGDDSIAVMDSQTGAIIGLGGEFFPGDVQLQTPDGSSFNLIDSLAAFESQNQKKLISPHVINKVIKISDGTIVFEKPSLLFNNGTGSVIDIVEMSEAGVFKLPDGITVFSGFSDTKGGYRYRWYFGRTQTGKTIVFWTSENELDDGLASFAQLVKQVDQAALHKGYKNPNRTRSNDSQYRQAGRPLYVGLAHVYKMRNDDDGSISPVEQVGFSNRDGYYLRSRLGNRPPTDETGNKSGNNDYHSIKELKEMGNQPFVDKYQRLRGRQVIGQAKQYQERLNRG